MDIFSASSIAGSGLIDDDESEDLGTFTGCTGLGD